MEGHPIEITGNDIVFQEEIRAFDETGRYQGVIPGIRFAEGGTHRDGERGIILRKIGEGGKEDPLTKDFQPRDAGLYDVVLVSRVAVQFFDAKEKVTLLRENAQRYLGPTEAENRQREGAVVLKSNRCYHDGSESLATRPASNLWES